MASPSRDHPSAIPPLSSLLGPRRGGRSSRGPARAPPASSTTTDETRENAVRCTDQDAAGSRVSCVELGYLHDPYAALFAAQPATRRLPLLNRGSYVRTSAIDLLITRFLLYAPSAPKQILSLGAGTDTRYFRLLDQLPSLRIRYHELDFPANTSAKLASIHRHPQLHTRLDGKSTSTAYYSETYNLHPVDLRTLASSSPDTAIPEIPNVDPSLPTLILSEMCLVYLQPTVVQSILHNLLSRLLDPVTPASLVLYEPILPNDPFGRTMISNLSMRNIHLPTLIAYPELGDQKARLKGYGFSDGAKAVDTNFIWQQWVSEEEKERVAGLEFLDELEELQMLLEHYCIAWAWRDGNANNSVFSEAWSTVKESDGG